MTRARLEPDGSVVETQADGSTKKLADETDENRLGNTTDEEIDAQIAEDPDVAPVLGEAFWERAAWAPSIKRRPPQAQWPSSCCRKNITRPPTLSGRFRKCGRFRK